MSEADSAIAEHYAKRGLLERLREPWSSVEKGRTIGPTH
jgi:hypothetical protein